MTSLVLNNRALVACLLIFKYWGTWNNFVVLGHLWRWLTSLEPETFSASAHVCITWKKWKLLAKDFLNTVSQTQEERPMLKLLFKSVCLALLLNLIAHFLQVSNFVVAYAPPEFFILPKSLLRRPKATTHIAWNDGSWYKGDFSHFVSV